MSLNSHPPNFYINIRNLTEYKDFKYSFDYVTVLIGITFLYFVPSFYCTLKMMLFYNNENNPNAPNGIHPCVFKSFILMQFWNTIYTILDFLLVRMPTTTFLTSFCASLRADSFAPFFVAALYFSYYTSQVFTVLFCLMRVLILYNPTNHNQLCTLSFIFWPPAAYVLSSVSSFPNISSSVVCMQLDEPYQTGAITISTTFVYGNKNLAIGNLIFSSIVMISIIFTTGLMMSKLRTRKLMSTSSRPFHRTKAETTLTVTMFLILIPSFFTQTSAIATLTSSPYYSYIIVVRPLLIDSRVSIVSCYFYFTHPIFKKEEISTPIVVRSLNATTC